MNKWTNEWMNKWINEKYQLKSSLPVQFSENIFIKPCSHPNLLRINLPCEPKKIVPQIEFTVTFWVFKRTSFTRFCLSILSSRHAYTFSLKLSLEGLWKSMKYSQIIITLKYRWVKNRFRRFSEFCKIVKTLLIFHSANVDLIKTIFCIKFIFKDHQYHHQYQKNHRMFSARSRYSSRRLYIIIFVNHISRPYKALSNKPTFLLLAFFYKQRFFSTQPQCCVDFSWIEPQNVAWMLLNTYIKHHV